MDPLEILKTLNENLLHLKNPKIWGLVGEKGVIPIHPYNFYCIWYYEQFYHESMDPLSVSDTMNYEFVPWKQHLSSLLILLLMLLPAAYGGNKWFVLCKGEIEGGIF